MDRPSSLAARPRHRRPAFPSAGGRTLARLAALALLLAFAHVWESVTLAELRTRLDREHTFQDQLNLRLHQLTGQLAQLRGRAEAAAGESARLGFTVPRDGQVVLISGGLVGAPHGARFAAAPSSPNLWDWVAGAASAETRTGAAAESEDSLLP